MDLEWRYRRGAHDPCRLPSGKFRYRSTATAKRTPRCPSHTRLGSVARPRAATVLSPGLFAWFVARLGPIWQWHYWRLDLSCRRPGFLGFGSWRALDDRRTGKELRPQG